MSRFATKLVVQLSDDERSAILVEPLIYESDVLEPYLLFGKVIIPPGFSTDFASIPRAFWNVLPPTGRYGCAAVVHDYLYRWEHTPSKEIADQVLLEGMEAAGCGWCQRMTIYRAVRMFGGSSWDADRKKLLD